MIIILANYFSAFFFFSVNKNISIDCNISLSYLTVKLLYHAIITVKSYSHTKYLETSVCTTHQEGDSTLSMMEQF